MAKLPDDPSRTSVIESEQLKKAAIRPKRNEKACESEVAHNSTCGYNLLNESFLKAAGFRGLVIPGCGKFGNKLPI